MAKKEESDIVLENLKGFVKKGAAATSPGNIPTGHFELDFLIHHGELPGDIDLSQDKSYDPAKALGIPLGKLVMFYGEESGGKSSLAYRVVGYAQKMGFKTAWLDTEHSFADNLAELNGVNRDELYYSNMTNPDLPDKIYYAEDIFDAIIELIKSGIKLIVLDSVANLVPKERMEASAEHIMVGKLARLMSENLGKIVAYADKYGATVIAINQLRVKIGQMYGCFQGETLVSFADGSRVPIKKVVEEKLIGPVLSYNTDTQRIESAEITNWYNNGDIGDEEWLSFIVNGVGTKNGRLGFTCTPNHTLFLSDGTTIPAEDVVSGDKLMCYYESKVLRDEVHKDIILGSLLGDGTLMVRSNTACFSLANQEQPEYLRHKMRLLSMFNFTEVRSCYLRARWDSDFSVELKDLYDKFYKPDGGYRMIPDGLILTPRMAAVWYMDDGHLKAEADRMTPVPSICIKRFRNDQVMIDRAISLIESLDNRLVGGVYYQDSGCLLAISARCADVFFNIVSPYMPKSMSYKVPDIMRQFCTGDNESPGNIVSPVLLPYPASVLSITAGSKRKYRNQRKT